MFRRPHPGFYAGLYAVVAGLLLLAHAPYLELPYFWDELGQFIPAALDILRDGSLIPHSAVPNVHPPGVMLLLAAAWKLAGYSALVTRATMLLVAALGVTSAFLLAIRLCQRMPGAPALLAVLLLLVDPLFYTQAMTAQLDMPAMVLTLAGLLLFLNNRHWASAMACTILVLTKETGLVLPILCAAALILRKQRRAALLYATPCLVLASWLLMLHAGTGSWFGDPGFAHYNIQYSLHPVRILTSVIRRAFYLFFADFRWIGTIAILAAARKQLFDTTEWRFTSVFVFFQVLEVSLLGGAELERYLLPVIPLFYIAASAGIASLTGVRSTVAAVALPVGLVLGMFLNPPYPFPFENNLAMADFVALHRRAAAYLEEQDFGAPVYTAWPLTAELRNPDFGYVRHSLPTVETSDLHDSTLSRLDPANVRVLVMYSRAWEPEWGLLRTESVRRFLQQFYEYEPQMSAAHIRDSLGLRQVARWTRRGQWVAVYAKP